MSNFPSEVPEPPTNFAVPARRHRSATRTDTVRDRPQGLVSQALPSGLSRLTNVRRPERWGPRATAVVARVFVLAAKCMALPSSSGSAADAGWCFWCASGPGARCRCLPDENGSGQLGGSEPSR